MRVYIPLVWQPRHIGMEIAGDGLPTSPEKARQIVQDHMPFPDMVIIWEDNVAYWDQTDYVIPSSLRVKVGKIEAYDVIE